MKCKNLVKEKTNNGRTIERKCNNELSEKDIFCDVCGQATVALKTGLNAKVNFNEIRQEAKTVRSNYYKFNLFILIGIILPIAAVIVFQKSLAEFFGIDLYLFQNLSMLFLVPFILIPFSFEAGFSKAAFTVKNYFVGLKHYPTFFLFTAISILFFFVLKILCTGYLIGVTVDPILHPVRFVLVIYWIIIMFPAPLVIIRKEVNAFKAVKMCYVASAETRWQQLFTVSYVVGVNILGTLALGLGLLHTISLSYMIIEGYFARLDEYDLFGKFA